MNKKDYEKANLILLEVLKYKFLSRSELTKNLNLNKGTVSLIIKELVNKNIIKEIELGDSTGGRKPIMLKISEGFGYSIIVCFNEREIILNFVDFNQRIIFEKIQIITHFKIKEYIDQIISTIDINVENLKIKNSNLIGIVISVCGEIDAKNKFWSVPNFGWKEINILESFKKYSCFILIDTFSRFLLISKKTDFTKYTDMILLNISSNVTGAVISNNLILKGFLNIAGSLGHISIDKNGRSCKCGRNG
ncbi:MAG: ROK family protein, partial [Fusobacteriaceae bacterium]